MVGRQWGEQSQGDVDYTYWNLGLTPRLNKPLLSLDLRYWDTSELNCPNSGVFSCGPRIVGSFKTSF